MQTLTYVIGADRRAMVSNIQDFKVDFSGSNYNWVQARQYERSMRQVFVNVVNEDGSPFDLTACNIWFEGLLPYGKWRILDAKHAVMLDPVNGQFRFDMPAQAFTIAGSYTQAFFRIVRDGNSVTTLEFDLEVLADKVISGLIPSDYITPFEDLYGQLEDIVKSGRTDLAAALKEWTDKLSALFTQLNNQGTETATLLTTLETQIKADGLMTNADLTKALQGFEDRFKQLSDDTAKALGDFKDDGYSSDFFNDESDEIGGTIPPYYLDRLNALASIPKDNLNLGFITDNHYQQDSYAPGSLAHYAYIAALTRRAKIDAVIAGGDNINGDYGRTFDLVTTREVTATLFGRVAAGTDVFFMFGNHDSGISTAKNKTTDAITETETKGMYHTYSEAFGEVRNGSSLYGYKDYSANKVRVIWLNSYDLPYTLNEDGTYKYDFLMQSAFQQSQLDWLANTALKLPDNTWQTMIFSHAPISGTFDAQEGETVVDQYNTDVLLGILTAYLTGTKYSVDDDTRELPVNLQADFTAQGKALLVGFVSGHVHKDGQMTYQGINCIQTCCSLCNYMVNSQRTANGLSEDCWDVFSIDSTNRKIHAYRFGYGSDRDFTY